jgi:hypothetical protein
MESKTILKVVGGALLLTGLLAVKKKSDFSKVLEQMTINIKNIRNLRLSGSKLFLNLDLLFGNPTPYDMSVSTAGLIKLKEISVFYKQKLIGTAISEKTQFELKAKSSYLISNVKVELLYLNLINQWLTTGLDSDAKNYQVHITVEALGKSWVIEQ